VTPNAIAQMSKYFWAVLSFSGKSSRDGFAMRYELHYQPKKVAVDGFEKFQQFGIINFHGKRGGEAGIIPSTKNKWSTSWTKAWFYCKVPLHVWPRGGKTIHALRSHMSALSFRTKPSIQDSVEDLSNNAFIWASMNIRGQDVVEEFMSCGVWPLYAGVDFEHANVDLSPTSQLKVPLPNFPLSREDDEDDTHLLARVEREARNIVGGYTRGEHEACITSLPNNGHLNRVLEVAGVSYEPHPVPVSTEILKKRKADAATKVSTKCSKVPEKKGAEPTKVSRAPVTGSLKWPSGADVLPAKSAKLSKGTIPRVIASAAVARMMPKTRGSEDLVGALASKAGEKCPGGKNVPGARAAPSTKKRIVSAIRFLVALSSEGTEESSPHDQAPEVQSKAGPHGPSVEPQARS
jgi:hypothetical protein